MLQKRKIPRWEIESYEPGDRNYDFSSYAVDKATEKRIEKKLGPKDCSRLHEGVIYTYKELCSFMDDKEWSGNANRRENQERAWKCYFDFEKIPYKGYKILHIYDKPKYGNYISQEDEREFNGKYNSYIYQILLILLYKSMYNEDDSDFYEFRTTRWNLYKLLGFANNLFFQNFAFPGDYKDNDFMYYDPRALTYIQKKFYQDAFSMFGHTLKNALESLHKCKKINYYWETRIVHNGNFKIASKDEEALITRIEGQVLNSLGYENEYEAIVRGDQKKYYDIVKKILKEQYDIDNYYEELDVWVIKDNVKSGILRLSQKYIDKDFYDNLNSEQSDNVDKLNKLIQEYFYNLNKNKGYQYSEYIKNKDREKGYITCIDDLPDDEKEFYDMHHVKDYQGISDKIQKERDDCVKKYIELKDYMDTIQNGVRGIVIPIKNPKKKDVFTGIFESYPPPEHR